MTAQRMHVSNGKFTTSGDREPAMRTDAVSVVYTTVDDTLRAARVGARLADAMGVPLHLVHFRSLPAQEDVSAPAGISPLETEEFVSRLRERGITASVGVYLGRDDARSIPWAIKPHSLVVVGGRRRWWPTRVGRLRRALEAAGHFVVNVDPSAYEEPSHA